MAKPRWVAVAIVVLLLVTMAPNGTATAESATATGAPSVTVTLVTGDRVTVTRTGGGRPTVAIEAARWPGRRVSFRTTYVDGELRVVPSDVARLLPTKLDPELFDVSGLIRAGYHDAATAELPLIVRGAGTGAFTTGPLRGGRALPSIGATTARLTKARAAELGTLLASAAPPAPRSTPTSTSPGVLTGDTRIWLDAKVYSGALDSNLTQVGAPAAWDAGLSGAGVNVAVLDTGVDDTHPDLAGQVTQEANFSDSPVAEDRNGHGTHVASLVAGTGAAAAGERRGVAFGATVLSGKVLNDSGVGQFSWIIAGMEWAAAHGARVVNLSLGSESPSTGLDPLSLAVNELTVSAGVLFVASAGNTGPRATTIGAPGAADAALTVGAVDRRDQLADFSSRGPRLGNYAIKPDLVAPGVDIIAARAAGTSLGQPIDANYTRLSGTSMAAPNVAGAAALLVQQHPEWTPAKLKALLIGTAAPTPGTVYERGSGRLDLATAIGQPLIADPPQLSYGLVSYPQSALPPMTRTLTFVNTSISAITVDLAATLSTDADQPTPAGMLTVTPTQLTVPAAGTAEATVTLAVALGGTGTFSGEATATTATGATLRVPIGVVKESTRHVISLHALDRNGTSNVETLVTLINLQDVTASPEPVFMTGGEAMVRAEPGFYTITAALPTLEEGEPPPDDSAGAMGAGATGVGTTDLVVTSVSIATIAEQTVDQDLDVVLDARTAVLLSASVQDVATVPTDVQVFLAVQDRQRNGFVLGYATSAEDVINGVLFVQPTTPVRHGRFEASSKWRLAALGDGATPTYDLLFAGPTFPPSLAYVLDPTAAALLAQVSTLYRAPGAPVGYRELRQVFTDINPVSVAVPQTVPAPAPLSRVEYVSAGLDELWLQCVWLDVAEEGIGDFCQTPASNRPGAHVSHDWLRAPLRTTAAAFRTPTILLVGANDLVDDGAHSGSIAAHVLTRSYQLYRNGVLIDEGTDPLGVHAVPPDSAVFRLTRTVELRPDLPQLSTMVTSAWTFTSDPPRPGQAETVAPLLDVAVHLPVDEWNGVNPNAPLTVMVEVSQAATSAPPRLASVTLEVSTDDGATWHAVALSRTGPSRYAATLPAGTLPPAGALSLRTTAADAGGNHTEQTILRAGLVGGTALTGGSGVVGASGIFGG